MEYMSQGLPIAIIGYCMVFVVLGILWGALEILRILCSPKAEKAKTVETSVAETVAEVVTESNSEPEVDEGELVAILTAAVAASLNTSTYNLKIKSYKRTDTVNNAWSNASRNDAINNF